jgi:hypothetical protein
VYKSQIFWALGGDEYALLGQVFTMVRPKVE